MQFVCCVCLCAQAAAATDSPCDPVVEALGSGVDGPVRAIASVRRGDAYQLYIAGKFNTAGGELMNNIAMWDGVGWNAYRFLPFEPPTIGVPGSRGISALEPIPNPFDPKSPDEFIMLGGDLLLGDSDSVRVFFPMEASITGSPVPQFDTEVQGFGICDIAFGPVGGTSTFALAGDFSAVNGEPIERIAQRSTILEADWQSVVNSSFASGSVACVEFIDDKAFGAGLYFSGLFERPGIDGPICNSICRWDGEAFYPLDSGLTGPVGAPSPATTMTFGDIGEGPSLYVAGTFTLAGAAEANGIARWDGSAWHALGGGRPPLLGQPSVSALAIFDDGSGPALYAAPAFPGPIARWDGEQWQDFSAESDGTVYTMAVHDDGSGEALYVGGDFAVIGDTEVSGIARIRGCAAPCPGDVTSDGTVDLADLNLVLANFGQTTTDGDTDGDGVVNLIDLNAVLANFGSAC